MKYIISFFLYISRFFYKLGTKNATSKNAGDENLQTEITPQQPMILPVTDARPLKVMPAGIKKISKKQYTPKPTDNITFLKSKQNPNKPAPSKLTKEENIALRNPRKSKSKNSGTYSKSRIKKCIKVRKNKTSYKKAA